MCFRASLIKYYPQKIDDDWICQCSSTVRIVSQKSGVRDYKRGEFTKEDTFYNEFNSWGYANFISFAELMDESRGLYDKNEDKVIFAIDFTMKDEKTEDKS
ncbi:hypothetical protein niasHT_013076 [Heterodera trifolii]|uniref:MATH domain-containing protein n=1 Tax=Heterodera trifolii TaxID=157864 RepID=A0ABD2L733_9BILA